MVVQAFTQQVCFISTIVDFQNCNFTGAYLNLHQIYLMSTQTSKLTQKRFSLPGKNCLKNGQQKMILVFFFFLTICVGVLALILFDTLFVTNECEIAKFWVFVWLWVTSEKLHFYSNSSWWRRYFADPPLLFFVFSIFVFLFSVFFFPFLFPCTCAWWGGENIQTWSTRPHVLFIYWLCLYTFLAMNQQEQAEEGYTEDYAEGEDPDADDEVEEEEPPKPAQTSQPMVRAGLSWIHTRMQAFFFFFNRFVACAFPFFGVMSI